MIEERLPQPIVCEQCGMIHPPLATGEKCPLAKPKDSEGKDIEVREFLNQLKNILISQIQRKKIKDIKKLFSLVLVHVTKYLEGYKE